MSGFLGDKDIDWKSWETRFNPDQRWWVPYTHHLEVVRGLFKLPERVTIFDNTLREGVRTPGCRGLNLGERLRILEALEAAGVREAEIGGYAHGPKVERDSVREAKKQGLKMVLAMHSAGWVQDWRAEIDSLAEARIDLINLLQYGCSHELATTPWLKAGDVPERSAQCVAYAKQLGLRVAFGLTASGRVHPHLEEACYREAVAAGADRVYIYDGFGVMTPEVMAYCVRRMRDTVGPRPELAVHCHNDLGLATANMIAAVQGGSTVLDASINGLGNRAGIAALDEVVAVLTILYGIETGVDLKQLTSLSSLAEDLFGIPLAYNKAVTGRNLYWHESDAHNAPILAGHWYSWNVIKAETVGRKNVINVVPHCLHKQPQGTIATKIRQMGYEATGPQFDEILSRLNGMMERKERPVVSESELEEVIRRVLLPP